MERTIQRSVCDLLHRGPAQLDCPRIRTGFQHHRVAIAAGSTQYLHDQYRLCALEAHYEPAIATSSMVSRTLRTGDQCFCLLLLLLHYSLLLLPNEPTNRLIDCKLGASGLGWSRNLIRNILRLVWN